MSKKVEVIELLLTEVKDESPAERIDMIRTEIDRCVEVLKANGFKVTPRKLVIRNENELTSLKCDEMMMYFTTNKGECRFFSLENK